MWFLIFVHDLPGLGFGVFLAPVAYNVPRTYEPAKQVAPERSEGGGALLNAVAAWGAGQPCHHSREKPCPVRSATETPPTTEDFLCYGVTRSPNPESFASILEGRCLKAAPVRKSRPMTGIPYIATPNNASLTLCCRA